jgi:uncharacterized protein with HEPN domain
VRGDREYLQDIVDAIDRIERYVKHGRDRFERDELVQTWMVHNLQIIGEAARALSADLRDRHPEVPWPVIVGMRNILVHQYQHIDTEVVWTTVESGLPTLKQQIVAMQGEMNDV